MDMSEAIVYVDHSEVREGALEELKAATKELADFVEANEPQLIAYNVYLSDDGTQISVVHVHLDSTSLEYHMEVAGPTLSQARGARHAVIDRHLRKSQRKSAEAATGEGSIVGPRNRDTAWAACRIQSFRGRLRMGPPDSGRADRP